MIEFVDLSGKKLSLYELSYYSGLSLITLKNLLEKKTGYELETAVKIEEILSSFGYKIPAEVFMADKVKKALARYIKILTDSLFEIREYNINSGKINEYNRLKAKDKKLYEEIRGITLGSLKINQPILGSPDNSPHH